MLYIFSRLPLQCGFSVKGSELSCILFYSIEHIIVFKASHYHLLFVIRVINVWITLCSAMSPLSSIQAYIELVRYQPVTPGRGNIVTHCLTPDKLSGCENFLETILSCEIYNRQ